MKQAVGWYFQALFTLGLMTIVWIVLIAVVSIASMKLKARARSALIVGTVLSFPSYVAFWMWYPQFQEKATFEFNTVISENASEQYRKLCASMPSTNIRRVVAGSEPVDIRIEEPDELYGLDLIIPQPGNKVVCWVEKASKTCSPSNIRYVEWGFQSRTSDCRGPMPPDSCKPRRFRNDRQGGSIPVDSFTSSYVLSASSGKQVAPLVQKFSVTVKEIATGEVLADTQLYRKSWFHNAAETRDEPRYCPARDRLIADMLAKVFPVTPNQPGAR
jgi:hypothetical protein